MIECAEAGYPPAQTYTAWCLENGWGTAKDVGQSIKLYQKAAEKGSAQARYNLGTAYEHGDGVLKNIDEAKKWYGLAAG